MGSLWSFKYLCNKKTNSQCFTGDWCFNSNGFPQDVPPYGRNMKTPTNKDTKDESEDGVDGFEKEVEWGVDEE